LRLKNPSLIGIAILKMLSHNRSDQKKYFSPHLLVGISAICLICFILFGMMQYSGILEFAELKSRMWLPHPPPEVSPEIVIVEIDNETTSEKQLGPLPWTISTYNILIWAINQTQPESIGLFIWFNREWPGDSLESSDNLFVIQPYETVSDWKKDDIVKVTSWRNIPSAIKNAEEKSFSEIVLTEDGLRRQAQIVVKDYSDNFHYSLELLIACRKLEYSSSELRLTKSFWHEKYLSYNGLKIPLDKQGRMLINFVGGISEFKNISFVRALALYESEPKAFENLFKDKIVLIGITNTEIPRALTPINELTALEMRANALNTIITKKFITRLNPKINLIAIATAYVLIGFTAIAIFHIQKSSLWISVFGAGIVILYLILAVILFYVWLIWLDLVVPFLAIFLCSLFVTLYSGYINLRILYSELQKTQTQLVESEKEAAIGLMSAQVRHEIRNILNMIRAPAELVQNNFEKGDPLKLSENPDEIVIEMDTIVQQVTRLEEMVENELSYFQNTNLNFQKHQLIQIISEAIKLNNDVINKNKVEIDEKIQSDLPSINADFDKLLIAFTNLIKNACQAMPNRGKLTIEADYYIQQTSKKNEPNEDKIVIIFRDTGMGIPDEDIEKIFKPFHTTKPRGLGLGLTVVKNIIEGHHGSIEVKSDKKVGTEFRITLPVE